jgi:trehalose 6-phosphate synthase/phosphatase
LLLVVVPSRIGVEHYQFLKQQIDEMVGKVNGKFGTISWTPIVYQYRSLEFQPLVALYRASDVALITPLRDGMNLISKEYVASRVDQSGVLVLSEMAGASSELGEAIIINPNNREEISEAIEEALKMPEQEQQGRIAMMQRRLEHYDVVHWAEEFLKKLSATKQIQNEMSSRILSKANIHRLLAHYRSAARRLLLQDYDGTLVPYALTPQDAKPPEPILNLLRKLAGCPKNDLVLISGRDKNTLYDWFNDIPAGLIAEHGAWLRERNKEWRHLFSQNSTTWKKQIGEILDVYIDRLPGSFVEEKEFTLVWHFRKADLEFSSVLAKELVDHLQIFSASMNIQVILGNRNVEIRNVGINKGAAATFWMARRSYDFILALGDDTTDEDLFRSLPEGAYSVKVGSGKSSARFNLISPSDALQLLSELASS